MRQSKRQCVINIVASIGIHNHDLRGRVHASLYLIHSCALNCTGSQGLLKGGPSFLQMVLHVVVTRAMAGFAAFRGFIG